eukprot:tig00020660_g12553.t1
MDANPLIDIPLPPRFVARAIIAVRGHGSSLVRATRLRKLPQGGPQASADGEGSESLAAGADDPVPVVLKIYETEGENDHLHVRMTREVQLAQRCAGPGVVRILEEPFTYCGQSIVCMEDGGDSLKEMLAREGPLVVPAFLELAVQAADALAHVHAADVVHCDVKPSNLVVARRGGALVLKLTDFNISVLESAADAAEAADSGEGSVKGGEGAGGRGRITGTFAYMSCAVALYPPLPPPSPPSTPIPPHLPAL